MERAKVHLPAVFTYFTELPVMVGHINYGGHLANDAVLGLMHEARVRYLAAHDMNEMDACGCGLIMADAVIVYKNQAYRGDILRAELAAADFDKHGFNLFYRLTDTKTGREIARARTAMATFDYTSNKLVPVPEGLAAKLG